MVNPSQRVLPDKLFFKIGEVAKIVGVPPHVLRYWESEFASLRPMKTRGAHRVYRRKDVELALTIHQLVHQEGYTVTGAKKRLRGDLSSRAEASKGNKARPQAQLSFLERGRDASADRTARAENGIRMGSSAQRTVQQVEGETVHVAPLDVPILSPHSALGTQHAHSASRRSKLTEIRLELQRIRQGLSELLAEPSSASAVAHPEAKVTVTRAVPAQAAFVSEHLGHSRKY